MNDTEVLYQLQGYLESEMKRYENEALKVKSRNGEDMYRVASLCHKDVLNELLRLKNIREV